MDDTTHCPICGNKFRNIKLSSHRVVAGKTGNYMERTCSKQMNHSLMLFADKATKKVDFLKLSLNPKYSRFLEIDYVNQKCRINCMKDQKSDYIEIDRMLDPDFPSLEKLREKISLFIVIS